MLFQNVFEILSYLFSYSPNFIFLGFNIAILVFASFIYKRNSYKYGRFLMISSIISIVLTITYISINYRNLLDILKNELGFSAAVIIYGILSWTFFGLEIVSSVYLFLSVYHIYKTHEKNRVE